MPFAIHIPDHDLGLGSLILFGVCALGWWVAGKFDAAKAERMKSLEQENETLKALLATLGAKAKE